MSNCEQCGAALCLPADTCRECGHPVADTPPGTSPRVPVAAPPTASFDGPGGYDLQVEMLPGDDAMRVERLLESIAEQSHYEQRYQIRAEIARGGMGQVYHAYDTILRRDVAIKMMREGYGGEARSSALRGQFLKEARVGGRLLHPNILAVFDLGVNRAGQIYYTMRLVDGASLQHSLDSVDKGVVTKLITYPLRRVVEAFVGACHGVDYAHQQGVIHLDLKPQNILVSGFNEVFVIDWGLARVDEIDDTEVLVDLYRERCGGNTGSNTGVFGNRVVGTPGYMAPEQTTGEVAAFGPATDVYGLGGVLHFILYGAPPNRGRDPLERMRATAERKARGKLRSGILARGQRVRKEASAALEALEAVCLKALEPHPPERYPDVEAMIVELSEWLASTPGPPAGF